MTRKVLYHVTVALQSRKRYIHVQNTERFIARVDALEDNQTFAAYHYDEGRHLVPDYAAIRSALIPQHRKAFDRALKWFPTTLHSKLSGLLDLKNAMSVTMHTTRGELIGTVYATPFLAER